MFWTTSDFYNNAKHSANERGNKSRVEKRWTSNVYKKYTKAGHIDMLLWHINCQNAGHSLFSYIPLQFFTWLNWLTLLTNFSTVVLEIDQFSRKKIIWCWKLQLPTVVVYINKSTSNISVKSEYFSFFLRYFYKSDLPCLRCDIRRPKEVTRWCQKNVFKAH